MNIFHQKYKHPSDMKNLTFFALFMTLLLFISCTKEKPIEEPVKPENPYIFAYNNASYSLGGQTDAISGPTLSLQYSRYHYHYKKVGEDRYIVSIDNHFYAPEDFHFYDTLYLEINHLGIVETDRNFNNPCYILRTGAPIGEIHQREASLYFGNDTEIRELTQKEEYVATVAGGFNCFEVTYTYPNLGYIIKYYIHPLKGIVRIEQESPFDSSFWTLLP
ncbi:MAG: hypothetical protein RBS19_05170 [Bacteroidales bacterium]|nr:hypothetical protein [Bacteroidales bacterium]